MKVTYLEEWEFDIPKEKARLKKLFKGEQRNRLLSIVDYIENGALDKAFDIYTHLPRDKKDECYENEFCGLPTIELMSTFGYGNKTINIQ